VTIDAAPTMEAALTRPGSRVLPLLGIVLVAGGLFLLGWFAFLWFDPGPAPYHYRLVEEGGVDKFPKLELGPWSDLSISKQEVHVEGMEEPVASAYLARRGNTKPVMLAWENHVGEPMVFVDSKLSELSILAPVIARNMPKDATILAWWDTSRQIQILTGLETVFTSHLSEPLITPMPWRPRAESIAKYERDFWGSAPSEEEKRKFQRFADALLAEPTEGAAILRELTDGREGYVVVHISDLYKLGMMRPDGIGVAYKDFTVKGSGDVHGLNVMVKRWQADNKFSSHTVHGLSETNVRAYFLTDDKSVKTLLAQMLPMTTSLILELKPLQMVYKEGGYLVYKIPSAQPANN
jgi:hydroxylamine oxidation protein HaoB